jgi:hypothetical protein
MTAPDDALPQQTPLIDLLQAVPTDARMVYEHGPFESHAIPVGRLCHEAQAEIRVLRAQLAALAARAGQGADMTPDAALPPLPNPWNGYNNYSADQMRDYAQRAVDAALAARAGQERPVAWVLAASLDILADRGEVNCTLWSDANKPEQEWLEPLYADDPRLTWGVPHAGTIRCLRAAEDRIRAGEPPGDVFADYGWSMTPAPCPHIRSSGEGTHWCALAEQPALPTQAREAMEMALDALENERAARRGDGGTVACNKLTLPAIAALRAALGEEQQ